MPKRTNSFQKLITLIHRTLAPYGAEVKESVLLDTSSGVREVDVLMSLPASPYRMKVAIEAKDESRPMDMVRFESIIGKYRGDGGVRVDKTVVCNRKGYSKSVKARAKALGIELFTLSEALSTDWKQLVTAKLRFQTKPTVRNIAIIPAPPAELWKQIFDNGFVYCHHGHNHGSFKTFFNRTLKRFLSQQPELFKHLKAKARGTPGAAVQVSLGYDEHQHWVVFSDRQYPITELHFDIVVVDDEGEVRFTDYVLKSDDGTEMKVQVAEALVAGRRVTWGMDKGLQSKRISMKIEPAD